MTLEKTLKAIVVGGLFAVPFIPLIVAHTLFFPFITGKNFTFRVLVEVTTAAWLALALVYPAYRPRRSWLLAALATFVVVIGAAALLGIDPGKSLWSNYERMEGWVTLAHLLAFFTVLYATVRTTVLWDRFLHTSIGASVLISLYGILQLMGLIVINQGGIRLDATFGNATYLAVYMLFHLFLTALMWHSSWRANGYRFGTSALYGSIMALQFLILFFTATRGAILGTLGGAVLSALILVLFSRTSRNAWRASVAVIVGAVLLVGGIFALKDSTLVQSVEPLRRLASISSSETTVQARFLNWSMALQGIKERPVLGWGQENYNVVFNQQYDPRMYAQEPWFDRVHNVVLDWLIAGGVLGLLSYLSLFAAALWGIWRSGAFVIAERSILTGLLAGYLFHNLFVFDNITSYIMFTVVLAYIAYRVADARHAALLFEKEIVPRTALLWVALVVVVGVWGVAWYVNAAPLSANRALIQALSPQQTLEDNIALFEKAVGYQTFGTQEVREQLVQGVARLSGNTQLTPEAKGKLLEVAAREMESHANMHPLDARFPFFLGILYDSYGRHDLAQRWIEKAITLSPKKQALLFQAGNNAFLRGDDAAAVNYFKDAFELEPTYTEARLLYGAAVLRAGEVTLGEQIIEPLVVAGQAADQRVVGPLVEKKRYETIRRIWAAARDVNPQNAQAWFAVAAAEHAQGKRQDAIKTLEAAAVEIPGIAGQVQGIIQQIKDGTIKVVQ